MQAGKPGSLFEGMLRGRDHQKEQRAGAHPLQPLTDGDVTCDPRVQGASEHGASPRYESSDMGGGDDSTGKRSRCPDPGVKAVIWGIPERASLCSKNVVGPSGSTTRDQCVDTVQDALPQQASVRELGRTYNALFLHVIEASTKISCTF